MRSNFLFGKTKNPRNSRNFKDLVETTGLEQANACAPHRIRAYIRLRSARLNGLRPGGHWFECLTQAYKKEKSQSID